MMENMKISVIIPAYNIGAYLPGCLDSVLAQTHQNLQIIVVDDGSSDETGVVLDRYAEKDSRILPIHKENGGVTRARFDGLRQADGDFIGFVDGDDYVEPDMYERLLKNALDHNGDISHCGYQMVFPSKVVYYYNTGCFAVQDKKTALKELLTGARIEPGLCNKLFRRELMDSLFQSGVETMGIKMNEDLLMNFYLFSAAETSVYEDFCPYHYMLRRGSATNNRQKECHYSDPLRVRELLLAATAGEPELYRPVLLGYVHCLVQNVTQKIYPDYSAAAKQTIKKVLGSEDKALLPKKERYMAWMAANTTPLYRFIRWVYEGVTGINHKYDVE